MIAETLGERTDPQWPARLRLAVRPAQAEGHRWSGRCDRVYDQSTSRYRLWAELTVSDGTHRVIRTIELDTYEPDWGDATAAAHEMRDELWAKGMEITHPDGEDVRQRSYAIANAVDTYSDPNTQEDTIPGDWVMATPVRPATCTRCGAAPHHCWCCLFGAVWLDQ